MEDVNHTFITKITTVNWVYTLDEVFSGLFTASDYEEISQKVAEALEIRLPQDGRTEDTPESDLDD